MKESKNVFETKILNYSLWPSLGWLLEWRPEGFV